jgi:nucleoside phosphorylase
MKLLLVASDRMEFQGILSRAANVRPVELVVDWSRSAQLNGNHVLLVANGAGARRATAAVDAALAGFRADAVVSMGFCGALDEGLEIADVIAATAIVGSSAACSRCTPAPRASGPICSIDHVAGTAVEKRQLRASGAIAVEMEAAGVAERAASLSLPLYVIKAVTDLAGETMANDFNAALRFDGHFDTMKVFTGTLRHPTVRIRELLRLRNRCVQAARVLGEFIADCRF